MKILHITPQIPGKNSGGMIVIRQTLLSLKQNGYEVDYVGPELEGADERSLYHTIYELAPSHNMLLRAYDTLFMNTNQRYRSWLKLKLDFSEYDAIVMDFTKLNYVLYRVPNEKLIVRVHNVERDYSKYNFLHNKTIANLFDLLYAGRRERAIVNGAAKLLVLTEKDKKRLQRLYGISSEKMHIVPVCIEGHNINKRKKVQNNVVKLLITGSLWFGSNYEGIRWFLKHVYPYLHFEKHLIIAGSRPNNELIQSIKEETTIELVDSPNDMEPYFLESDLSVVPIFDGAGMKVKVAEAMSYGLPVVGTSHGLEGYDIAEGVNVFRADTAKEFIYKIKKYAELSAEEKCGLSYKSYLLYKEKYSQENSVQLFKQVIETEMIL